MTVERMIELLKIEHECMLRCAHDDCDRKCADCELVQEDGELHEMYTNVIWLLKEQEHKDKMFHALEEDWKRLKNLLKEQEAKPLRCNECSYHRNDGWCNEHGREVKESDFCSFGAWEGR